MQQGTLRKGDFLLIGQSFGRVRALLNENNLRVKAAYPSDSVAVLGISGTPRSGDVAIAVENERKAKEIASKGRRLSGGEPKKETSALAVEEFLSGGQSSVQRINLLVKADVHGMTEALRDSLTSLETESVRLNLLKVGVGGISSSDIDLAAASQALILGFNVRTDAQSRKTALERQVRIRYYSVIYELMEDVSRMVEDLTEPELREHVIGCATVKEVFRSSALGQIAGSVVEQGTVKKSFPIRVLRNGVVVYEGELESLKRFKENVSEVAVGVDCGIGVKAYNDVRVGDQIEVFERRVVEQRPRNVRSKEA